MNLRFMPGRDMDGQPAVNFHFVDASGFDPDTMPGILQLRSHDPIVTGFELGQPGQNTVLQVGQALFDQLAQHAHCAQEFLALFNAADDNREVRLKFSNSFPEAKRLPWEALYAANNGFLNIDNNVPILREVAERQMRAQATIAANEPLRFLAVLGAAGNDGEGEWQGLQKAFAAAPAELPLSVLLLSSNRQMVDEVNAQAARWLKAEPSPINGDDLIDRIARFRPHVAHFFAHGFAGPPAGIEVESANAVSGGAPIMLSAADLTEALSDTAWLVLFNACSLAGLGAALGVPAGEKGAMSLCEDLVASGIPIVVGMRRDVDANRAHRFTRGFHRRLLRELGELREAGKGVLKLGACFTGGCRAILDVDGGNPAQVAQEINAWTLPIMNVRREPFVVEFLPGHPDEQEVEAEPGDGMAVAPTPGGRILDDAEAVSPVRQEILGELDMLRALLKDMGDSLPPAARQTVEARIAQLLTELMA